MKPAYNYTEYVLFSEMVHKGIPIENTFTHFDNVEIMVSQGHSVPKEATVARLSGFPVAILSYNVLYSVELSPTMVSIDYDMGPSHLALFLPIHYMVLRYLLLVLHRCLHYLLLGLTHLLSSRTRWTNYLVLTLLLLREMLLVGHHGGLTRSLLGLLERLLLNLLLLYLLLLLLLECRTIIIQYYLFFRAATWVLTRPLLVEFLTLWYW